MADKDYFSFEEVLNDLQMEEDELKRLVSAGEIRAFRDRETMRFKAEDIDRLREGGSAVEELDVEDLDLEEGFDAGDELVLEEEDEEGEELLELEELGEELVLETEVAPEAELTEVDLSEPAPKARRVGRETASALPGPRRATRTQPTEPEHAEGTGTLALLILGFVVMLLANFLVLDAASGHSSNSLTKAIAEFFR